MLSSVDQQRDIVAYELAGDPTADHQVLLLRIAGPLDLERLRRAIAATVARHDVLRARLDHGAEGPEVVVGHGDTLPDPEAVDDDIQAWAHRVASERLDLTRAWQRIRLGRLPQADHMLAIVVHRIGCDTESVSALHDTLLRAYADPDALDSATTASGLAAYLTHAARAGSLAKEHGALARAAARLAGDLPAPELPLDAPRPALFSGRGQLTSRTLAPTTVTALHSIARDRPIDPLFLAAYVALLQRWGQKEDFAIGLQLRDLDPTREVGPWASRVVLRATFPVTQQLSEVITALDVGLAHAREDVGIALHDLEQAVGAPRDPSRTPLFQVAYARDPELPPSTTIDGVTFTRELLTRCGARTDLTLRVRPTPDGYVIGFEHATDIISSQSVDRMLDGYEIALASLAAGLDQPIGRLPVMSERDHARALSLVSHADYDVTAHAHVRFERNVANTPDAIAATMAGKALTYRDLDKRGNVLAARLIRLGVTTDTLVGVYCERSLDMLVAILAVLKAGGAYVPLDPSHPAARIQAILEDAAPRVMITQGALQAQCPIAPNCTLVLTDDPTLDDEPSVSPAHAPDASSLAYVIFTSGSTGRPKGVEITHGALNNFLSSMAHTPGMTARDRIIAITTLSFDIAGLELWLPLTVGASVEIVDRATCVDARALIERLRDPTITMMQATPATWRMLVEADWIGNPRLRILCGGEGFPPDLVKALLARVGEVWNVYGPTETTVWSTAHRLTSELPPISIGRPIDNTSVYLLSPIGEPVPPGAIGEICIGGDGVARGYRGRPDLTRDRFVPDRFSARDGARVYRTGDLGRLLPDGTLACLGRVDFQVKIRGYRIELGDIESALIDQPEVKQAVVVAREDSPGDKRLVAYLVTIDRSQPELVARLRATLEQRLPAYMVPAAFVMLDALPLNPSGKIDRRALPPPNEGDTGVRVAALPANDTELILHVAFTEVLGVAALDVDTSFFDAGGDSLLALRLLRKIAAATGRDIPIADLFATPSIRALAGTLKNGRRASDAPSVVVLRRGEGERKLFCVGGIALYQHLARSMPADTTVYGLFASSEIRPLDPALLNRGRVRYPTVQELAADYIDTIRSVQAHGPYCLTGISFGGVVAYEVARQLRQTGDQVAFLALLDALMPRAHRGGPLFSALRLARRAVREPHVREIGMRLGRARLLGSASDGRWSDDELGVLRDVLTDLEIVRYGGDVEPYHGDVILVTALDDPGPRSADAATAAWERVVRGNITRYAVAGEHLGILAPPFVTALADALAPHLA